jgi:uncharacterized ubiquitin-like protein YukD
MFFFVAIFLSLLLAVSSRAPISVVANVRGKKYDVAAESVEELTSKVQDLTGIDSSLQSVLFKGKVLGTSDKFEDLGIASGDVLNVVKGRKSRVTTPEDMKESRSASFPKHVDNSDQEPPLPSNSQSLPSFNPDDLQKAKEQMDQMLDSNYLDEFFSSDEKLEQARVRLLENLDKYEQMMPGFREQTEEVASDPVKWKEAMLQAKNQMMKMKEQRGKNKGNQS